MKRDMELVRKMLLVMEEQDSYRAKYPLKIEGYDQDVIFHHAWLMENAGLIFCLNIPTTHEVPPQASPRCINWEGYEFLDAARDDAIWNAAMQKAKAVGAALPFTVLAQLLMQMAKEKLGMTP